MLYLRCETSSKLFFDTSKHDSVIMFTLFALSWKWCIMARNIYKEDIVNKICNKKALIVFFFNLRAGSKEYFVPLFLIVHNLKMMLTSLLLISWKLKILVINATSQFQTTVLSAVLSAFSHFQPLGTLLFHTDMLFSGHYRLLAARLTSKIASPMLPISVSCVCTSSHYCFNSLWENKDWWISKPIADGLDTHEQFKWQGRKCNAT